MGVQNVEPTQVKTDDFRLVCKFTCCTREYYDEDTAITYDTQYFVITKPSLQTKTVSFDIAVPDGATIAKAQVYATLSTTTYGVAKSTINGVYVGSGSTVCVDVDIADGATTVNVPFEFLTLTPSHQHAASGNFDGYGANWEDWYTNHEAVLSYENVYLLIEYAGSYTPPELIAYTDPNPVAGETYVKAVHMTELHENVNRLRVAKGLAAYVFAPITAMQTTLAGWNAHVLEIRAALDEVSADHDEWIVLDVNRPRLDVLMQLRSMVEVMAE